MRWVPPKTPKHHPKPPSSRARCSSAWVVLRAAKPPKPIRPARPGWFCELQNHPARAPGAARPGGVCMYMQTLPNHPNHPNHPARPGAQLMHQVHIVPGETPGAPPGAHYVALCGGHMGEILGEILLRVCRVYPYSRGLRVCGCVLERGWGEGRDNWHAKTQGSQPIFYVQIFCNII